MPQFIPRDVATQYARFESDGLQHLGYPSREGLCLWIYDVKELKERLLKEWRLLGHFIIAATIMQWHSHEYYFLVCFICFINTSFHTFDGCKHVQSANIA